MGRGLKRFTRRALRDVTHVAQQAADTASHTLQDVLHHKKRHHHEQSHDPVPEEAQEQQNISEESSSLLEELVFGPKHSVFLNSVLIFRCYKILSFDSDRL